LVFESEELAKSFVPRNIRSREIDGLTDVELLVFFLLSQVK
jgi:hypothetical protein